MSLEIVTYCDRCGEELYLREVDGRAFVKPCECCVPRPTLDAPVPTEPGWYWGEIALGRERDVIPVKVWRDKLGIVYRSDVVRWSVRLPEPEVKQ